MLDFDNVYSLCNQKKWYTRGTNKEYEKMFDLVRQKAPLIKIATDIYTHSNNIDYVDEVLQELKALSE